MGFRSAIRNRHVNSHCSFQGNSTGKAPSRQGTRRLDEKGAVQTAPCAEKCHFEMSWFKMYEFSAPPPTPKQWQCPFAFSLLQHFFLHSNLNMATSHDSLQPRLSAVHMNFPPPTLQGEKPGKFHTNRGVSDVFRELSCGPAMFQIGL